MSSPKVSFIIPLYNHLPESKEMLDSLLASIPIFLSYEVILIDDASEDGTPNWLESLSDNKFVKLFNQTNLGYAVSNNKAVMAASGEILCLLNNDLIFQSGWFEPMLKILEAKELRAGLVGNIQTKVRRQDIDHAGVRLNYYGKFEHVKDVHDGASYIRVRAVTGACLLMRRQEFLRLGAFDAQFVNGGEDVDLCYRLREAGLRIYVALHSRIQHHISLSRKQVKLRDEINSRYLQRKWRNQIKRDLAKDWLDLISGKNRQGVQCQGIDGELCPDFLEKPQIAALLIAENMLRRNEAYWMREIDKLNPQRLEKLRIFARGCNAANDRKGYIISMNATFSVFELFSIRNFYICGFHDGESATLEVSITVNAFQLKSFVIQRGKNFNLGIIEPLLLPNSLNIFSIRVEGSVELTDQIRLTHIVIDDEPIYEFILH